VREGALYAGCTFFGGYPITPSDRGGPNIWRGGSADRGAFLQMEDEIAAMAR